MNRTEIIQRLESAGQTLLMLPMPANAAPRGHKSNWPPITRTYQEWFTAQVMADSHNLEEMLAGRNAVTVRATQRQMDNMDAVLRWMWYIEDTRKRGVVSLRSLRHPVSEKHLYGWRRIARMYRMHENTIRKWNDEGIDAIQMGLALELCA